MEIHWRDDDPSDYDVNITKIREVQANGTRTISLGGIVCKNEFACELDLYSEGMGSATCVPYNILPLDCPFLATDQPEHFEYFVENNGRGFRLVETDVGTTVLGSGARQ